MSPDEPLEYSQPRPFRQLLDEIREKLWTFSVFVYRVDGERPAYRGTATCVCTGGARCLLTAAHVWRALPGDRFAVGLDEGRLLIPIQRHFVNTRVLSGNGPDEWGPDLALIRLPDLIASDLRQRKAFYDLDRKRPEPRVAADEGNLWTLIGAPEEQSTFGPGEAVLRLTLFDSWIRPESCEREGFDYVDVTFDHLRRQSLPHSYGGISGSGLWRIPTARPSDGLISWTHAVRLEGVAFFQKPIPTQQHIIRCHGRKSIYRRLLQDQA